MLTNGIAQVEEPRACTKIKGFKRVEEGSKAWNLVARGLQDKHAPVAICRACNGPMIVGYCCPHCFELNVNPERVQIP